MAAQVADGQVLLCRSSGRSAQYPLTKQSGLEQCGHAGCAGHRGHPGRGPGELAQRSTEQQLEERLLKHGRRCRGVPPKQASRQALETEAFTGRWPQEALLGVGR